MGILSLEFFAVLALDVFGDWFIIVRKNRRIKHGLETAAVLLLYLAFAAINTFYFEFTDIAAAAALCTVWPSIRWVLHDLLLNLARGLEWDYLGSEQTSAAADDFLNKLIQKGWSQFAIKLAVFGISAILAAAVFFIINLYSDGKIFSLAHL